MGSLGYVMFQLVGTAVLVLIAIMIAMIAAPPRSRRDDEWETRRLRRPELQHSGPQRLPGYDE